MSVPQNFRSAFHGFNREDVASYLEYLNKKYQNQINQLTAEIEELRSHGADPQLPQTREALEEYVREATAQLAAQLKEEQDARAELEARCAELEAAGEEAAEQETPGRELEAYRRAERIERSAQEHSQLVYYRANGVLAEAAGKVESAAAELTRLADETSDHLTRLQVAVSASKQVLQETASLMNTIRPNN